MIPGLPDTLGQAKREDIPGSARYRYHSSFGFSVATVTVTALPGGLYIVEVFVHVRGKLVKLEEWTREAAEVFLCLNLAREVLLTHLRHQAMVIPLLLEPGPPDPNPTFWDRLSE